jgi:hypothetical protein
MDVISRDFQNCHHCVTNTSSFNEIRYLLRNQEKNLTIQNELKYVRCLFNILNVINIIMIFIIFGGPKIITLLTLITACMIFVSIYLTDQRDILLFDFSIVGLTAFIAFKCVHTLILEIVELLLKNKNS